MARKEQITKQMILDGAFDLVRTQGIEMLTARKLAAHISCSTQPIFRVYTNMEELSNEEIQQHTGLQPNNIRVILSRARKTIRDKLIKGNR